MIESDHRVWVVDPQVAIEVFVNTLRDAGCVTNQVTKYVCGCGCDALQGVWATTPHPHGEARTVVWFMFTASTMNPLGEHPPPTAVFGIDTPEDCARLPDIIMQRYGAEDQRDLIYHLGVLSGGFGKVLRDAWRKANLS